MIEYVKIGDTIIRLDKVVAIYIAGMKSNPPHLYIHLANGEKLAVQGDEATRVYSYFNLGGKLEAV